MERYSGVAWAVSEAQRSQAISDGAWDGGGHSSRDGGGMGIAGQAIEASDGDGGDGGDGGEREVQDAGWQWRRWRWR